MPIALAIVPQGFAEAEKALKGINNGFPKAAAEAINKGLVAGRQVAVSGVGGRYNIGAGAARGQMTIKKASWGTMSGRLEAKGPMLPASLFKPSVRYKRIRRRGPRAQFVSVAIIKGNRKEVKQAFMAQGRIWERRGPGRDAPIGIVSTIGIPYMVRQTGILNRIEARIAEVTLARLAHNVALFTGSGKASWQ